MTNNLIVKAVRRADTGEWWTKPRRWNKWSRDFRFARTFAGKSDAQIRGYFHCFVGRYNKNIEIEIIEFRNELTSFAEMLLKQIGKE